MPNISPQEKLHLDVEAHKCPVEIGRETEEGNGKEPLQTIFCPLSVICHSSWINLQIQCHRCKQES
jgi:hypothetical protein